ncbi:Beach [Nesidiocoris tenuis]|uniref:Beach n=1 Tax=Nesidiocoris tenuis TaxID=355587 RepID=A0ABN7B576_9HEMI|nr:Beach [Nesidiocoris tenuis]
MARRLVETELKIPPKYCRDSNREGRVEAVVSRLWLRQVQKQRRIPEFVLHDKLSEDEVCSLFKQGEQFGQGWKKIIISVLDKGENQVIPLPRARLGSKPETQLSLSQILQYVSTTNYKNLWKEAYKKYDGSFKQPDFGEESYVQLTDQSSLLREALSRAYGAPLIRLSENQCYHDSKYGAHANLLPATFIIESASRFYIVHECLLTFTVLDCVTFSPALLSGGYRKPMFIIYQLLRLMRHFHDMGLVLGEITLSDIYIGHDLWIQVIPQLVDNVCHAPKAPDSQMTAPASPASTDLNHFTSAWVLGAISNYDYLCALNGLAGRKFGDPRSHYVLPWVSDLTSRSGAEWRDFTKSKFRLNKGDRQLDLTFDLTPSPNSPQISHHVPDVLSEITYYVYLSRVTPKSILCKYVRPQWVPAEYPASIQRLQSWSPDECIPEFFTDPNVFKSIHNDLGDLEVPSWCSSPQEFVAKHRSMLESQYVSERLNHWIDLTFGYKLSGPAAVKAKNVCLPLVDGHTELTASGVVQLFTSPHPHRRPVSPFWGRTPPRIHPHRRRTEPEEDEGHSSGMEEETPSSATFNSSRFFSKSRASFAASPLSATPSDHDKFPLPLPKDFNPTSSLNVVESLHTFTWNTCHRTPGGLDQFAVQKDSQVQICQQIVASKRAKEMQTLGCLIVEIFLTEKVRVFGLAGCTLSHRLDSCRSVVFHSQSAPLPRCVKALVHLLLEADYPVVTDAGVPPPSAHQLLQPLLTSSYLVHFSKGFPLLYQALVNLYAYNNLPSEIVNRDASAGVKLSHLKVMSLANCIEQLVDKEDTLELILPYILEMLTSPQMDVLAAWYLFDHVARALGPQRSADRLLNAIIKLYDCDTPREPQLLKKRVKLYHRSFLIRLIVRFGLSTFLDTFVLPLVEAVGGYHDLDQSGHSHLGCSEVEEAVEADLTMPLSPLDEDSSADSEKNIMPRAPTERESLEQEIFHLEEEAGEELSKEGPKSAISIQNLIIDNLDSHSIDEKEGDEGSSRSGDNSWRRKSVASVKHLQLERESSDVEYTKVYVAEVCEVSGESVVWLAQRLGPVLTSRYLSRNLLRMLGLCYAGAENLVTLSCTDGGGVTLVGDDNAFHVLRCLSAIATLYGEQLVVVQYLGHATDLVTVCRRKITSVLEGALVGCLSLISKVVGLLSDHSLSELLSDTLLRGLIHPSLRLLASFSATIPSGKAGRRALAIKVLACLVALARRADHKQRVILLQTIQRFFFAFTKAHDNPQDRLVELPPECELKTKHRLRDEFGDSPPLSLAHNTEAEIFRHQAQEELKDALCPEFAYLAFKPFVDFFGQSVMEQNLRNFHLVKELCDRYVRERRNSGHPIPGTCDIEPPEVVEGVPESPIHIGSFSNAVVIGNRIDLQETGRSVSPGIHDDFQKSRKSSVSNNRHLHGNWLAYWEHELGRNAKDCRMNIKQIKLQTFAGHCNSVKHIVCLASENSFMSASRDKTVRLWSLRSQGDGSHVSQAQWTYTGHRKSVLCLGWIERQRLTVSSDSTVHLWDPFVGRPVTVPGNDWGSGSSSSSSSSVTVNVLRPLHPPSSAVACGTTDGTVRTLDARTGSFVNELKVSQNPGGLIRCLVVSPRSGWLAVGQASGMLTVLDLRAGSVIMAWKAHDAEILQLVAVDENTLVSSALDQTMAVWDINEGKMLRYLKAPMEPIHCLEVVGGEVISGTTANRIGVHTSIDPSGSFSSTRLKSDTFKGVLTSMAVLPLNRMLLLGGDSGVITLIC